MAGQLSRESTGAHGIFDEMFALFATKDGYQAETLSGNVTLTDAYPFACGFDPGGSHRDVTLDAEATADGMWRLLVNKADAAENLVVKDDSPATIATINQDESGLFHCRNGAWAKVAIFTTPLS